MGEKNVFTCELCNLKIANKTNYYRHKKYLCPVKLEQEKMKSIEAQNEKKLYYEAIIDTLKKECNKIAEELTATKEKLKTTELKLGTTEEKLEQKNKELFAFMRQDITFMRETQKTSTTTLDKSVDALTFLMTHRKNAPELKELTHEKAQAILTHESRLYDYLLHYYQENMLDQYIGEIILKYIKKENPDDQSVWNSDVSRLTYLIRAIVDESPTWLRDPNGAMFNKKIIMPVINEITNYLYKCLHSKHPEKIVLGDQTDDSDNESDSSDNTHDENGGKVSNDSCDERELMKRTGSILGTVEILKSKKYRKSLSEYIASHIPLHKIDKNINIKNSPELLDKKFSKKEMDKLTNTDKSKKIIKKKPVDSSDSDAYNKPKKVIKKKPVDSSDSDTYNKPKKVIKKKPVDSSDSSGTHEKPRRIIRKNHNK